MFRRNISLPSSGSTDRPRQTPASNQVAREGFAPPVTSFYAHSLLGLFFSLDDGGDMFLGIVS
jgi:hypothetical protein